ncbi:MAG TPA: CPBP family intramembrane glutamic endopeptidase [Lacunisphaera sp.]|nr:CPBP family intramembrane glutamic endopeptidase [Lacunisphaera sp.]
MPTDPVQLSLAIFEITLLFAGAGLLVWLVSGPRQRQRWLHTSALPHWPVTFAEFLLFLLLVVTGGFMGQTLAHSAFGQQIAQSPDQAGLQVFVYGAGFHGGILAGCVLFPLFRRRLYSTYGSEPDVISRFAGKSTLSDTLRHASGTLLVALPVLTVISLGWTELLRAGGMPDEPQDLIARFAESKSSWVIVGMLFVACVLAPISEELLFRAGLYRFVRQKLGRTPALLISSLCFGAVHGNWAGSLPLAVLGMILAIVYEATGSVRVVVVAHGLFNLNTILIVLSGLPEAGS